MTDLGPVIYYFRLRIIRDVITDILFLSQETYIQKILECFDMQNSKGVDTLIVKKNILIYLDPSYQINSLTII